MGIKRAIATLYSQRIQERYLGKDSNNMKDVRIKNGKKGNKKKHGGYVSTYQQPYGATKRIAKRREQRLDEIPDGNFYKKLYGPLELS